MINLLMYDAIKNAVSGVNSAESCDQKAVEMINQDGGTVSKATKSAYEECRNENSNLDDGYKFICSFPPVKVGTIKSRSDAAEWFHCTPVKDESSDFNPEALLYLDLTYASVNIIIGIVNLVSGKAPVVPPAPKKSDDEMTSSSYNKLSY